MYILDFLKFPGSHHSGGYYINQISLRECTILSSTTYFVNSYISFYCVMQISPSRKLILWMTDQMLNPLIPMFTSQYFFISRSRCVHNKCNFFFYLQPQIISSSAVHGYCIIQHYIHSITKQVLR